MAWKSVTGTIQREVGTDNIRVLVDGDVIDFEGASDPNGLVSGVEVLVDEFNAGKLKVNPGSWRIDSVGYNKNVVSEFTGIALSASGKQRYIAFYGNKLNDIVKVEGVESAAATLPSTPVNTVLLRYTLITDTAISQPIDLSPYLDQSGSKTSVTLSGTNNYAGNVVPTITSYYDMQCFLVKFINSNTIVTPSINLNGIGNLTLVKGVNGQLLVGDILAGSTHIVMLNPSVGKARILTIQTNIPAISSGEKILSITPSGPEAVYETENVVYPTVSNLDNGDFSSGQYSGGFGLAGQVCYGVAYRYDCVANGVWKRTVISVEDFELYLSDIDDASGAKTSSQLQSAYPNAVIGNQVRGVQFLYTKRTTTLWFKTAITQA